MCIFAYGENKCVAAIQLAASNSPPDSKKEETPKGVEYD